MRLATFNILHGHSLVDDTVDVGRFARAVAELDADVLALQEVDRDQPRSHGADLTAVAAEAMGAPEHRFVATLAGTPELWSAATGELQPNTAGYGIALLSRYPVLSWRAMALPALRGRVPVVFPDRRRPTLVRDEPRAAVGAVVDAPGGPVTVVATHLTFIPGWNGHQLRRLVRLLRQEPRPVVVMGDLNLEADRPARVSGWRSLASAPTFPVAEPQRQLDHILVDGPLEAVAPGWAMDTGLSDHRALAVDVARR
ncbi:MULTISPECIES: endonuclease/exonuclease/phosphatase family protein [unclassified Actinotalea]|uniref:endonuclease/exonuclease/phosphatase family protein n=1 Tax=unclassified Actinotalea TaxID=2638618 RepID=UPI0015F5A380|nr:MULTISPECIES: endonuclease/exonuclease/phosphatase family protein [unclassified Actinotalea]